MVFGNEKINARLDYNKRANITLLTVNGQQVVEGDAGIYSMITTKDTDYSTLHLSSDPVVIISGDTICVSGIKYAGKTACTAGHPGFLTAKRAMALL